MTTRDVPLIEEMRKLFRRGDVGFAHALAKLGKPVSCGRGCSACCELLAVITWPEALVLAQVIAEAGELDRMIPLLVAQVEAGAGEVLSAGEYFKRRIACAFLTPDKACSVYADRPFPCRFHVAFSPAADCDDRALDSKVETIDTSVTSGVAVQSMKPILEAIAGSGDEMASVCAPLPLMVLEALRRIGVLGVPETVHPKVWHERRRAGS